MKIFTDHRGFAAEYMNGSNKWKSCEADLLQKGHYISKIFAKEQLFFQENYDQSIWKELYLIERSNRSQYDLLIDLARKNIDMPEAILCIAGSGKSFHGFRNRPWASLPGNIHLSAFLRPDCEISGFGAGFIMLSAISVVETIDTVPSLAGKARFKWVNDIVIDNKKVSGVLAQLQMQSNKVAGAVLGIGLNVLKSPKISPTEFVPEASSLNELIDQSEKLSIKDIFGTLKQRLEDNFLKLKNGGIDKMLDFYRTRSAVIGRDVKIFSDPVFGDPELIAEGKVMNIGNNLEIFLDSRTEPVTNGRLVLK